MSENMSATPPAAPGAPEPKKTNWLLIGGIVVGVLALCVCVVCVGGPVLLTAAAPQFAGVALSYACGVVYTDLTQDQCSAWGNDIATNHQQDFLECNESTKDSSGNTDVIGLMACLEDRGLGPKD